MKKIIFTLLFVTLSVTIFAQKVQKISLTNSTDEFTILQNEPLKFSFNTSISTVKAKEIFTKHGNFNQLFAESYVNDGEIGSPSLPTLKRLIEIPYNANIKVNIISYDEEIISLNNLGFSNKIIPQQPSVRKDQDVDKLPFHFNEQVYLTNDFIESPIAEIQNAGIMRGVNIGRLVIRPIQYNPVQNEIRILKNIVVEVNFENADIAITNTMKAKYYSPLFQNTYKMLSNYKPNTNKDAITTYPVKYVIVSPPAFQSTLQPFVQWKTKKGFKVVEAYTNNPLVGSTTTSIKNYLQGLYNAGTPSDPAPSFVLFLGDVAQIPAFAGTTGSHVTDLYYCEYTGDKIPECYYGRFSATTIGELTPQIDKTLEYEQYLMPDPSFLNEVVMIAGQDATYGPLHGDGQINYGTSTYFNPLHNLNSHTYLYAISGSSAAAIISNVSSGCSFANYTAHGSSDGWADPEFSISDISTLSNANKYPLMVGNCCLTNKFDDPVCFGEALLRASNKGALGYIGGSNSTYWDEDYWWGVGNKTVVVNPIYSATNLGSYDKTFHDHGEISADWFETQGQMISAGNLAVTQSGSSYVDYYWEIYHLMGDPSLMPYLGIPTALSPVTYQNSVPFGPTTVTVITEPYSYVGLSLNNVWIDAQYTGASGIVNLDISTIASPCTLDVVITKQNRQPHIGTILMVPNNTPYVVYQSNVIHDSGIAVNGIVEYSENVNLDVTLKNVGSINATNINSTLSTTNSDITITDNTEAYGNINANSSATQNNAFAFNVANVITDQQFAQFTITATDGGSGTWQTNFNILLNAPVLQATTITVNDATGNGNGRLDPGESVTINVTTINSGHAISPSAVGTLNLNSGMVTIPGNTSNFGVINASGNAIASFTVNVDAGAILGSYANFTFNVNAGGYTATKTFSLPIGLAVEDFETNTFTQNPWDTTHFGDAPWTIINSGNIYEGNFTARSGVISDNKTSELTIQITVMSADTLSFYKKVSSELDYDFLRFYVDGSPYGEWSGEVDWSREAYMLTTGLHTIKWIYSKDIYWIGGSDAAWVDFIIFPSMNITQIKPETNNNLQYFTAYPNPFKSESLIMFNVTNSESVNISLLNTLGETVKVILPTQKVTEGTHQIQLSDNGLSAGIYFCKLNTGSYNKTIKVIITK